MSNKLIPNYTDADFNAILTRLKTLLSKTDTYKDYNFEGSNISILMELVAYVGDLNTFFANKLAQNIHPETANIYEVVHSLVRQQGYNPQGYVAGQATVIVRVYRENPEQPSVYAFNSGDVIRIPRWFKVNLGLETDDGQPIYYCTTKETTYDVLPEDVNTGYVDLTITMRQGVPQGTLDGEPQVFTYGIDDVIDNEIILPFNTWDMDVIPFEYLNTSVEMVVTNTDRTTWTRVPDFFDKMSALSDIDTAYMLTYDKYKRYTIKFSDARAVPQDGDTIEIYLIQTLGEEGTVGANTFNNGNKPDTDSFFGQTFNGNSDIPFVSVTLSGTTTEKAIDPAWYTWNNENTSVGASDPQTTEELKESGEASAHSQKRNVTMFDYIGHLEERSDITRANAWGEQEENPNQLNYHNYNRAYLTMIPSEWDSGDYNNIFMKEIEIARTTSYLLDHFDYALRDYFNEEMFDENEGQNEFNRTDTGGFSSLLYPIKYNPDWEDLLLNYLEDRKVIGVWETFVLPELIYFRFDIGLRIKRSYNYVTVREAVKRKMDYYFETHNRYFNETIDFRNLQEYLLDTTIESDDGDTFEEIYGVRSLVIRDVVTYRHLTERDVETTGGAGTGLVVDYVQNAGTIVDVIVSQPGEGYNGHVGVTTEGSGTGLKLTTETVDNAINDYTFTNAGTGYSVATDVATTGNGTDVTVDITSVGNGTVVGTIIQNGGTNYLNGQTNIGGLATDGVGVGLVINYTVDTLAGGEIDTIVVVNGGSSYVSGDIVTVNDGFGDDDAQFTVTAANGVITGVTLNTGNYDCTVGQTVTITGGDANATFTIDSVVTGAVLNASSSLTGSGYEIGEFLTLNNDDELSTPCIVEVVEVGETGNGDVLAVEVVAGGSLYKATDRVTVVGGMGNAVLRLGDVDSIGAVADPVAIIYGGTGYGYTNSNTDDELFVFDDNNNNDYPHYVDVGYSDNNIDDTVNNLVPIKLGFNQFPVISLADCLFMDEG